MMRMIEKKEFNWFAKELHERSPSRGQKLTGGFKRSKA